mgnify:CR=1 FL=1
MNKDDEVMNDKDKMLIVNYYALTWWVESLTSEPEYFKSPEFKLRDTFVEKKLRSGEASTALILPCLYVALVLPKESLKDEKYKSEFSEIDKWLNTVVSESKRYTSYSDDSEDKGGIKFTYHIRNAVSHNRVEMIMGDGGKVDEIRFRDIKNKNGECSQFHADIGLTVLGQLVQRLRQIMWIRINEIIEKQRSM